MIRTASKLAAVVYRIGLGCRCRERDACVAMRAIFACDTCNGAGRMPSETSTPQLQSQHDTCKSDIWHTKGGCGVGVIHLDFVPPFKQLSIHSMAVSLPL